MKKSYNEATKEHAWGKIQVLDQLGKQRYLHKLHHPWIGHLNKVIKQLTEKK